MHISVFLVIPKASLEHFEPTESQKETVFYHKQLFLVNFVAAIHLSTQERDSEHPRHLRTRKQSNAESVSGNI